MKLLWIRIRLWFYRAKVELVEWGSGSAAWRVTDRRGVCWWLEHQNALEYALDRRRELGALHG